ncbi:MULTISPECIES: ATP-dependent helicase [unclassified Campylobacter]|uniref:ATP-dependent helicase n=1 Tax=unclassified Campylobacter TaxID=2593542 RepID=UPI0022E9A766|nr:MULTISPECIES: UvrD-helicase domain-containing protein [unclassified Campylobacter]MDA3061600.1 UvrD-helicase domain-containing protein [Campylobacter sp. JMF_14 EL1]MDA3073294.1 UvrD-helicase domain-containing protein [Campylobacter sp. JMF_10 EL2]
MKFLDELNEAQRRAALHIDGAMLILAGAGSGKTKTITARLAYLLANGVPAQNTLTLTFTNKAASEMRSRALNLIANLGLEVGVPLLCTFHKFGLLFLKFYISELGRKPNFAVIDTYDKKKILKSFEINLQISTMANEISKYKNALIGPDELKNNIASLSDDIKQANEGFYAKMLEAYTRYEEYLLSNNLVDFDDLLVLPYKILDANEALCDEVSRQYTYITVDEYQDTNEIQFKLLQKLCKAHQNLTVVGDDDQSIYSWRGARVENILKFRDQFENVKYVKLEENYRSTSQILFAANELISHNKNRLGKNLKSTFGKGEDVKILHCENESDESAQVAAKIKELINSGIHPAQIAVLYRVNALSRALEEGLNRAKIAYRIVGGVKFYERAEIKDIIAYLRLIINENDDFSMRRIINVPKRGVGKVSLARLDEIGVRKHLSLFDAFSDQGANLSAKSKEALEKLKLHINELSHEQSVEKKIDGVLDKFELKEYYEGMPEGDDRLANINEFCAMLKDEAINKPNFDLGEFLNDLALLSDQDNISAEAINIMSVHASKGLEFSHLFVIGLEEGFFPIISDTTDLEEERRLAYVAITRAKKELTLSFANSRFYRGKRDYLSKSRFLGEAGLIDTPLSPQNDGEFKKGDLITHKLFGMGKVSAVNGDKLTINFGGIERMIMKNFVQKLV